MGWLRRLRTNRNERVGPVAEPMEPRLLYSADLAGALLLASSVQEGAEQRTLTDTGEYGSSSATARAAATATEPAAAEATAAETYAALPLTFEVNEGQAGSGVDFQAHGSGYGIALSGGNATLSLATANGQQDVTLALLGAKQGVQGQGLGLLEGRSNYVLGDDRSKWHVDIANYGSVVYRDVYDGIDVRYYGTQRQLEYDFIVGAGADTRDIRLKFEGVESARIANNGDLVLRMEGDSEIRFKAPVSYQRAEDGSLESVASRYKIFEDGSIGFVLGKYDHSRELVIDPVLDYATYYGASGNEAGLGIATDAAGNVYVTGYTTSTGGAGGSDIFVVKFSGDLSGPLVYATRIGGLGDEEGRAIAVDANGNVAVTGWTQSANFPTVAAEDNSLSGGQDAVVFKLDANGVLVFSTYAGGSGATDVGNAVGFDAAGNVYAAGQTSDVGLGILDPLLLLLGTSDNAFLNKYDADGDAVYEKLLGGLGTDAATGMAVTSAGVVYLVGTTDSINNVATVGAAQTALSGASDGFLMRIGASGAVQYGTYVGGTGTDAISAVALDAATGRAYVVGTTQVDTGVTFQTTTGAFQTTTAAGARDTGFLRIYDTTVGGSGALLYSTYIGGSGTDTPTGVAFAHDRVIVFGRAGSSDMTLSGDAIQATNNGGDAMFLLVINPAGLGSADLQFGTYYAKDITTTGGVAVAGNHVYLAGSMTSGSGSTPDTHQPGKSGASDALVVSIAAFPNNAPVLTGAVQPPSVLEDSTGGAGFLVSSLLAGMVTDPDAPQRQGIAITAASSANGTWQYSTNGGTSWTDVASAGAVSAGSALLLAADSQTRLRFIPATNFNGTITGALTFRAWDRSSGTATGRLDTSSHTASSPYSDETASIDMTVTPVADFPTTSDVVLGPIAEDSGTLVITTAQLLANSADGDGTPLSLSGLTLTSGAASGTLTDNGDGTWTFTPAANFNGTVTFGYSITSGGDTIAGTASLAVTAVADLPTTSNVVLTPVAEDSGAVIITTAQLLGNAVDVDGTPLTLSGVTLTSGAASGTLVDNGDGTWTFTPAANFNGTVTFGYSITSGGDTIAGTASMVVTAVADLPSTSGVTLGPIAEDSGALIITAAELLANAVDVDGTPLTVSGVTIASGAGTLVNNGNGTWTFTPGANFNGTVTFGYSITSGGDTIAGTASLAVTAVADLPTTSNVVLTPVAEDSGAVIITTAQLLGNAVDVDGTPLTLSGVTLTSGAASGTLTDNGDGTWTFTPAANFNGNVTFGYSITSGGDTIAGTASMAVTAVADLPTTSGVTLGPIAEDSGALIITAAELLAHAVDVDGTPLTVSGVTIASGVGTLVNNGNGTWTFTPGANFNGTVTFGYSITSGGDTIAGTASLAVTAVADLPTTSNVVLTPVAEDSGAVIITTAQLLGNAVDVDGTPLALSGVTLTSGAASGTLTDNGDGTWTFTPAADFNGTVTFGYSITSGGDTIAGTASMVVTPVADLPTTSNVTLGPIAEDSGALIITAAELLANAVDVDGTPLTVSGVTIASGAGTLVNNGNGTWTFTPGANFNGAVTFGYSITSGGDTVAGTATLAVTAAPDLPTTSNVVLPTVAEDSGAVIITTAQLLGNAADADGTPLSVSAVTLTSGAASGTLTDNGDGTWTFTPRPNFTGTATFGYSITSGGDTIAGTASLAVTPVADLPTTSNVTLGPIAEDSGALVITAAQLLANASDPDGTPLRLSAVTITSGSGALVNNGNGTWTFTPGANFNGTVTFGYNVRSGGDTVAGTASLVVTAVADLPTTSNVLLPPVAEDSGAVIITTAQLLGNAVDVDGTPLTLSGVTLTSGAASGTLTDNGDGTWTFTPAANFNGTVTFGYSITSGGDTIAGTASLVVTPVADLPTTSNVTLGPIAEDSGALIITAAELLANASDGDGTPLTVSGVTITSGTGTLVNNGNGTWTFTPGANFNGTVTFGYNVRSGGDTVAGTASLLVTPVADLPTTSNVVLTPVAEDSGAVIITTAQLLGNAIDADGTALMLSGVTLTSGAASGTLVDNGDGTWTFTPAANFNGTVTFGYSITSGGDTIAGTASLAVTPVADLPTTSNVSLGPVAEDSGALIITAAELLANASDGDGTPLTVSGVTITSGTGTLVNNGNGTWVGSPGTELEFAL